jgi:hypothetical protein
MATKSFSFDRHLSALFIEFLETKPKLKFNTSVSAIASTASTAASKSAESAAG